MNSGPETLGKQVRKGHHQATAHAPQGLIRQIQRWRLTPSAADADLEVSPTEGALGLAVAGFPEGTISVSLGRRRRQIVLVLRPLITSNPRAEDDDGQETIWGHLAKVLAISSLSW